MEILIILLWIAQVMVGFVFTWLIAVSFIGNKKSRTLQQKKSLHDHRFAVVICAHNEETVIGNILESLSVQTYDPQNWKVYVIADRCTDHTGEIAKQFAFVTVLYRNVRGSSTKGLALEWGIERVLEIEQNKIDAIMVLDADNLVIPEFLSLFNEKFCEGSVLLTGKRVAMNPYHSLISKWYSIYWSTVTELFCQPHYNLGLSSLLSGTGFAFSVSLLEGNKFHTISMSEDIEFSVQQNLKGVRVDYLEEAIYYDEQPVCLSLMYKQLRRWTTGSIQITRQYTGRILKTLFHKPSLLLIDSFISLILCGNIGLLSIIWVGNIFMSILTEGSWLLFAAVIGSIINVIIFLVGLIAIKKSPFSVWKMWDGILTFPIFGLFISFTSFCSYIRPQTKWHKIEHFGNSQRR